MAKKSTKPAPTAPVIEPDEEGANKPTRKIGDSACMASREDLEAQHGADTLRENEARARKIRAENS